MHIEFVEMKTRADTAEALVAQLRAEGERKDAALKPFAKIADEYSDNEDDTFQVWKDFDVLGATMPLRIFRSARAALTNGGTDAGDTLSLDNDVRVMKSHWDDAEERATTAEALVAQLRAEGERKDAAWKLLDAVCHDQFHRLIEIQGIWRTLSPGAAEKLAASIENLASRWGDAREAHRAALTNGGTNGQA